MPIPALVAGLAVLIPGAQAKALDKAGSLGFQLIGAATKSVQHRIEMGRLLVTALEDAICPDSPETPSIKNAAKTIVKAMGRKDPPDATSGTAERFRSILQGPKYGPDQIMRGSTYLLRMTDWVASVGNDRDVLRAMTNTHS